MEPLVLGRIVAPHGLRGGVKVHSFTDPPEQLLQHRRWRVRRPGAADSDELLEVIESQWDGRLMRVMLAGVADRDAAERLQGREILIPRSELPAAAAHEHFRDDLVGFSVRNVEGVVLGVVQHFLDAPAGAIMVVQGEREHWLPATAPHLKRVDVARRELEVDWPADF